MSLPNTIAAVPVETLDHHTRVSREDFLAVEEALEIRLHGTTLTITMRTPGEDFDLAAGLLLSEGLITSAAQVQSIRHTAEANTIDIELTTGTPQHRLSTSRNFASTASCGICGKASPDALQVNLPTPLPHDTPIFTAHEIHTLPGLLRQSQHVFGRTGGLHAAALFRPGGHLLAVREDIGRHNAVDKLIGHALRTGIHLASTLIFLSGRAGFELIQKSAVAGIPFLAAVGAPTSLAVETAKSVGMTLAGFVRDDRFNIYAGGWRITQPSP